MICTISLLILDAPMNAIVRVVGAEGDTVRLHIHIVLVCLFDVGPHGTIIEFDKITEIDFDTIIEQ